MDTRTLGWSEFMDEWVMDHKRQIFRIFESEFIEYLKEEKGLYLLKARPGQKRFERNRTINQEK